MGYMNQMENFDIFSSHMDLLYQIHRSMYVSSSLSYDLFVFLLNLKAFVDLSRIDMHTSLIHMFAHLSLYVKKNRLVYHLPAHSSIHNYLPIISLVQRSVFPKFDSKK